jgi:hypothetical protein
MTAPAQPARLTSDELAQALAHVLDTNGRIRGRDLDASGIVSQLIPCQLDVMHLYIRAVAAGLFPRWIEPPDPAADNPTLLHAWAALARVLPKLFPGEVISITSRTPLIDLPDDRYKVLMTEQNAPVFVDQSESMVRLLLSKRLAAPANPPSPPAAAPPPTSASDPALPRLSVDVTNSVIYLDGQAHPVSEKQAHAVQCLLDAKGGWVSSRAMKDFPASEQRPDRWIAGLPDPVRVLIEGKTGAGYRLTIAVE